RRYEPDAVVDLREQSQEWVREERDMDDLVCLRKKDEIARARTVHVHQLNRPHARSRRRRPGGEGAVRSEEAGIPGAEPVDDLLSAVFDEIAVAVIVDISEEEICWISLRRGDDDRSGELACAQAEEDPQARVGTRYFIQQEVLDAVAVEIDHSQGWIAEEAR